MPGWKTFFIAVLSGAAIAVFFTLFWRWPPAISLGVGVLTSALVLLTSVSIGVDPARADRAWREAAPDLVEPRAGPRGDDAADAGDSR
jgi:hypothetical protein